MGAIFQQPTIIGQLPLSTYTVILLGFRVEAHDRDVAIETLHRASSKLTTTFPFLAGQVVLEGKDDSTSSGTYRATPYEPHSRSFVHVKDCSDLCPSLDDLLAAKAPVSMLDGKILSPKKGFFYMYDPAKEVLPVFHIQASFIKGGILLCFAGEVRLLTITPSSGYDTDMLRSTIVWT
jgi:trichothecene 3-O-acetyltransferase